MWTALVAAACLLAFVMHNSSGVNDERYATEDHDRPSVREPEEVEVTVSEESPQPTLLAYCLAAGQSPGALDELLDEHAEQLLRPSAGNELAAVMGPL